MDNISEFPKKDKLSIGQVIKDELKKFSKPKSKEQAVTKSTNFDANGEHVHQVHGSHNSVINNHYSNTNHMSPTLSHGQATELKKLVLEIEDIHKSIEFEGMPTWKLWSELNETCDAPVPSKLDSVSRYELIAADKFLKAKSFLQSKMIDALNLQREEVKDLKQKLDDNRYMILNGYKFNRVQFIHSMLKQIKDTDGNLDLNGVEKIIAEIGKAV